MSMSLSALIVPRTMIWIVCELYIYNIPLYHFSSWHCKAVTQMHLTNEKFHSVIVQALSMILQETQRIPVML